MSELLQTVRTMNTPTANFLKSDTLDSANVLSKVRHLGLQSLTISGEVGVRKPNAKIFKVACERAGVLPKEAMLIGDSIENDIVGANQAGMTSVFIDRNSDVLTQETADEQPDSEISNLYDVLSCLKHIPDEHRYN